MCIRDSLPGGVGGGIRGHHAVWRTAVAAAAIVVRVFAAWVDYAGQVLPAHSPALGAKALALSATANLARALGQDALFERANRPLMRLAEMQPVTAAWWRERRGQAGEFLYLALGDSTAQGIGASVPGRSYVGQLADRIEAQLGAPIAVTNLGVSGAPTRLCVRDQLPRAKKVLAKRIPNLVTLSLIHI